MSKRMVTGDVRWVMPSNVNLIEKITVGDDVLYDHRRDASFYEMFAALRSHPKLEAVEKYLRDHQETAVTGYRAAEQGKNV